MTQIGNLSGRLVLVTDDGAIDVEKASSGRFGSDPQAVYGRWAEFREWAAGVSTSEAVAFRKEDLGSPAPRPGQVFAIGANYRDHAEEGGMEVPEWPLIFTKFPSSITGPYREIELPSGVVDWEVELVFVMGKTARNVPAAKAWEYIAGVTIGQDLSEREVQMRGQLPQMGLGKSLPDFSPMGPFLVTPDSFDDPDDLEIGCTVDGETVQSARTKDLLFSVSAIVELLSALVPLEPGDVVWTGTMGGVGMARKPPRFLEPGQELVSRIEGIGEMRHTFSGDITEESRRKDIDAVIEHMKRLV
ncbi:fumarylacetoacetate hydrolase family protein [Streptomyces sp. Y7]|uniref:fumarylacetoacetate hydrolase family protein n=1 Tax=Streptomyces sp. Y7 TaxID=3342392 RepID=UPI00372474FD